MKVKYVQTSVSSFYILYVYQRMFCTFGLYLLVFTFFSLEGKPCKQHVIDTSSIFHYLPNNLFNDIILNLLLCLQNYCTKVIVHEFEKYELFFTY